MTKKYVNGELVDMTAEEISQRETDASNSEGRFEREENARVEKENLKASAKAKLVAGDPLTAKEADTIIL